jgi:NADH-quinone oxidoreductase subunit G
MPKIVIDEQEIEVARGTKVIKAAEQLGIMIPRFCYHPALGSVGACRVCAVKFIQGPFKGVQMSCMIEAQDDMVVSTTDEEAVDFRRHIIEWLMLNHPHDCPVCDEGGHCLLQDMTVSGGHGIRRYLGSKRTYPDQYLGPLIQHEMNRCIHCYRCARYYQEFSGYFDLGVMRNANRTYFGRFQDGCLESPFSGNLGDICPTGVYTDKPSRFSGRRWDYERSPSLCVNCSLGCHTVASIRYRDVRRLEARFSDAVNGYFICDRGRYGFFYTGLESRPRRARMDGKELSISKALPAVKKKLAWVIKDAGTSSIAAVGSPRSSLETQGMLRHLCRTKGWRNPVFFGESLLTRKVQRSIARLEPELTVSLRDVEKADFILALGADPINEAPMLAMAMRQAQRAGAKIVVMDPRPISLPLDFHHLPAALDDLSSGMGSFIKSAVDRKTAESFGKNALEFYDNLPDERDIYKTRKDLFAATANDLNNSRQPLIVCGTDIVPGSIPGLAADMALLLQAAGKKAGLYYLLPGANAFTAGLLSDPEDSFLKIIEDIDSGVIKCLILAEADPFHYFSDRQRLERALDSLDLLIAMDYIDSPAAQKAHFFLPALTLFEAGGIFVNQEGRLQAAPKAFEGGIPIVQSGSGNHPPRIYGKGIPGLDALPAWQLLAELTDEKIMIKEKMLSPNVCQWLAGIIPEIADLKSIAAIPKDGVRLKSGVKIDLQFAMDSSAQVDIHKDSGDSLELIFVEWTFGTEELSAYSACLQELEREPAILMHAGEAERLGLFDGNQVLIQTDNGRLEAKLKTFKNMAAGIIVLPRHRLLPWQIFESGRISIGRNQIKKVADR